MQRRLTNASFLLLAAPMMAACSYFGGDAPKPEAAGPLPPGKLTSECARLQPLFTADEQTLSREKMDAGLKSELVKWDTDKNGELSNSETGPLNDALRAENVGASPVTDWNGDGHVDFQEFASGWRTMFDLCDRNRDKLVSYRELGHSPNVTPPPSAPSAPKKPPPEGASSQRRGGY